MTKQELIKQAYAYGAAVALQELGYSTQQAEAGGIKLAASSALPVLFGGLGGAAAAPEGQGWKGYAGASAGADLGGTAGLLGGAALGTGAGMLANVLSKGRIGKGMMGKAMKNPNFAQGVRSQLGDQSDEVLGLAEKYLAPTAGGIGGGLLGGIGGRAYGAHRGFQGAIDDK